MAITVAIQGERGSFSEEAAQAALGNVTGLACREFRDVGAALENGSARYAVLPVENSIAGSVLPAYDVLASTKAHVIGEVTRYIRHCVLGVAGTDLARVRRVLSHPVALAQCGRFFRHHPHIEPVAVYDTAGAAQEVAALGDPQVAAIAGRGAGLLYGLAIVAADVHDRADNQTRFYILSRERAPLEDRPQRMKTALLLETGNEPGSLVSVLLPIAQAGVNLSKLESRPGETPWTYRFFIELDGAIDDANVTAALQEVCAVAASVRVLGSFAVLDREQPVHATNDDNKVLDETATGA